MKRTVTKQRRFGPGEFASLARQCMEVINKGESVFDFLAGKGVSDPVNEWYDIRRWIKSNAPEMYVQIPTSMKLELPSHPAGVPVQRINSVPETKETKVTKETSQEMKETSQKEPEMPLTEPKRRAGRPPKAKSEGDVIQIEARIKEPQKGVITKVMISEVQGNKVTYTRRNDKIILHVVGFGGELSFSLQELKTFSKELPQVIRILGA